MSITLLAPAEDLRPEITAASWSDEQDGVLITFRKNGIEGDYKVACRLGAKDEPWSSGGANGISDSGDTVEYFWKTGNLVPGETSSFWIDVVTPDGTTVVSDEAEVTVPLANAVSPIKILEFSVPDLSASKLKKMREDLLTILLQYPDEPERYLSVCNDYYDEAVSAVFRSTFSSVTSTAAAISVPVLQQRRLQADRHALAVQQHPVIPTSGYRGWAVRHSKDEGWQPSSPCD